jgi:hypothetical protein
MRKRNQDNNKNMEITSKVIQNIQTQGNAIPECSEENKQTTSPNIERPSKHTSIVTPSGNEYNASPESGEPTPESGEPTPESRIFDSEVKTTKDTPELGNIDTSE